MTWIAGAVLAGGVPTDSIDGLPFQDIGFAGLLGIVVWWLVRRVDRDDTAQAEEVTRLRAQVELERVAHQSQLEAVRQDHTAALAAEQEAWRSEFSRMREWMNDQIAAEKALTEKKSDEKHIVVNRLQAAEGPLDVVAYLATRCTCHALDPAGPVLARWREQRDSLTDT